MTSLTELVEVVIGVDTHVDTHTAAVVNAATGGVMAELTVEATAAGYAELVAFASEHSGLRAWAIEGTGIHGAGLTRHLEETVCEVAPASAVVLKRQTRQKTKINQAGFFRVFRERHAIRKPPSCYFNAGIIGHCYLAPFPSAGFRALNSLLRVLLNALDLLASLPPFGVAVCDDSSEAKVAPTTSMSASLVARARLTTPSYACTTPRTGGRSSPC